MPRGNQNVDEETIDGRSPDGGRRILSGTAVVKCAIKAEPVRLVSRLQHVKIASSTYFAKESSFSQLATQGTPLLPLTVAQNNVQVSERWSKRDARGRPAVAKLAFASSGFGWWWFGFGYTSGVVAMSASHIH